MVIVCSTDDNFVQHCVIMLTSLLCHNKDVDIYIITEGLSSHNEMLIKDECSALGGTVHICVVKENLISKFPMPADGDLSHITVATYYRFFTPEILPDTVHKAIYLDCDIVVRGSLQPLWDTDMDGYAIAAVPQVGSRDQCMRLGIPMPCEYFNAGVLLINLDYWRQHDVSRKLINYVVDNPDKIFFHDQDGLNAVLHDVCRYISPTYNMTSLYFDPRIYSMTKKAYKDDERKKEEEIEQIRQAQANPLVIHYVFRPKPWQKGCSSPWQREYYLYAGKTKNYKHLKHPALANLLYRAMNLGKIYGSVVKQTILGIVRR